MIKLSVGLTEIPRLAVPSLMQQMKQETSEASAYTRMIVTTGTLSGMLNQIPLSAASVKESMIDHAGN